MNNHLHFSCSDALEPCCSANIGPAFIKNLSKIDSIKNFVEEKRNI